MALARCPEHRPKAITEYVRSVEPLGYPNEGIRCGHRDCVNPAVIWLTELEAERFHKGWRKFAAPVDACMFVVQEAIGAHLWPPPRTQADRDRFLKKVERITAASMAKASEIVNEWRKERGLPPLKPTAPDDKPE